MRSLLLAALVAGLVPSAVPAFALPPPQPCAHAHQWRPEWGHGGDLGHFHPDGCHGANGGGRNGAAFTGEAAINCFGCGVSTGTADLTVISTGGMGSAFATYTVFESPAQCPVTGSATGSTTGSVVVDFNWTRVGATAVITTTGDINGGGVAAFAVTNPLGNPCGGPVTAAVVGAIAGA